jgi:cell division protein FtsZ
MDEIDEITEYIQNESGNTADIIWGNGVDETLENKICVTIIATGFGKQEPSGFATAEEPKKVVRNLNEQFDTNITASPKTEQKQVVSEKNSLEPTMKKNPEDQKSFEFTVKPSTNQSQGQSKPEVKRFSLDDEFESQEPKAEDKWTPHSVGVPNIESKTTAPNNQNEVTENPVREGLSEEDQIRKTQERIMKLKALNLKLKTPGGISDLEKEPAYKRRNITLDDTPHSSESNLSRYTLSEDEENKTSLKQNNSFLHDNVD